MGYLPAVKIIFGPHAEDKFELLARRGFPISKNKVLDCVQNPDKIEEGYKGRKVAQKTIDETHVVRVVYMEMADIKRIITFYPGRRERYED